MSIDRSNIPGMRKITFSLLIFIPFLLSAQSNLVVLEGKVTDVLRKPIPYATIQAMGTDEGTNADATGHYIFRTRLPAILKASFIGYKTVLKKISPEAGKDTIQVDFVLALDSAQLQQVEITATQEPQIIRESGSLIDFETNENKLWLLLHYRNGDHLEVYDTAIIHCLTRIILKYPSEQLTKTPYNYLYIENSDSIRLFDYNAVNNSIDVGGVTPTEFHRFLHRLITYHEPFYYYKWDLMDGSNVTYSYADKNSLTNKMLYYYKDVLIARQNDDLLSKIYGLRAPPPDDNGMPELIPEAMSEQKGYHPRKGEDGRNKEDTTAELQGLIGQIFCPLKIIRDSIYIFNFDDDSIYVYNLNNSRVRQMPLAFYVNGMKYKARDILVSEEGDECYFKFVVSGKAYLQKIDLNSGTKMNTQKLGVSFPEKLRIMSGYAYYTTSDDMDNGMFVRHLYRQRIN